MKEINNEVLSMLFNHFYSNRWHLVGHVVRNAMKKGIDCSEFPRSLTKMTVYGFFISTYPTLLPTMEKIDEYDLLTRLKMFNLIKKTIPLQAKKWSSNEKSKLNYDKKTFNSFSSNMAIISNSKKSNNVAVGVKVRVK